MDGQLRVGGLSMSFILIRVLVTAALHGLGVRCGGRIGTYRLLSIQIDFSWTQPNSLLKSAPRIRSVLYRYRFCGQMMEGR